MKKYMIYIGSDHPLTDRFIDEKIVTPHSATEKERERLVSLNSDNLDIHRRAFKA
jgi:hypothetical protein